MLRATVWLITLTAAMFMVPVQPADAQTSSPLELAQTIALADVRGRIDHLAVDPDAARLFVAALGNDSVEVVDLHAGTRVARIKGLHEPQGIGYVRSVDRLFVANAGGGVDVFEASTLRRLSRIAKAIIGFSWRHASPPRFSYSIRKPARERQIYPSRATPTISSTTRSAGGST
jgi:hypothetical protein